jgi:outer membrane protein
MSPRFRKAVATGLCLFVPSAWAQQQAGSQQVSIEPVRPVASIFTRPYKPADVPPVRLGNSGRLGDLIRGGNLYLTAHDAVSLALENNVDIEVARYNPTMLAWRLERSQAGGSLPGVPSGATQASSNTSGQGVLGSQQAAGVSGGNNGTVRNTSNATVTQIGPVTQTLDPTIQESTTFSHRSLPQSNATQSITQVIVQNQRVYSGGYQQGFITGGSISISYNNRYLNENAPTDVLNPSVSPGVSFSFTQNLLNGFGEAVGGRTIRIAKMNLNASDLVFRTQVTRTVGTVLNTYFALVGDFDDVKSKQNALDTAQKFLSETQRRLDLGSVAELDVFTAQNQSAIASQGLVNSQVALAQQEVQLKNLISRAGSGDPILTAVHIVPLDRIEIPASDDLPPVKELVQKALTTRTDILSEQIGIKTSEVNALGTKNGLLPSVQVIGSRTTSGIAGTPQIVKGAAADPRFVGGIGTALEQVFAQNFPTESLVLGGRFTLNNRQAQADYGIDQLSLRQQQLTTARDLNQAQVDVMNAVVAINQARARYDAAVQNRVLQQKLYDAEQKKYSAGESTTYNVTQQLRDLNGANSSELAALVTWKNARINLDQNTGMILEANRISISDARTGKVAQGSSLPAALPQ